MKKTIFISLTVVLLILASLFFYFFSFGQDFSKYESLKQPQIRSMKNQKMIEIRVAGDPNLKAGNVFKPLYATFYRLKNNHSVTVAPRVRWPIAQDVPRKNWIGIYGLPVSDSVTKLPKHKNKAPIKLVTWEYGLVAEILHIGPYSAETPTIHRLKRFIADNGYEIIGDHEEEYLRGPGFFPVNPKRYYTIIRYRIQEK